MNAKLCKKLRKAVREGMHNVPETGTFMTRFGNVKNGDTQRGAYLDLKQAVKSLRQ